MRKTSLPWVPRSSLRSLLGVALLSLSAGCGSDEDAIGPQPPAVQPPDPVRACMTSTLPRLTVQGNQLMVRCGSELVRTRLKGINRSGLQHKIGLAAAGFPADPTTELKRYRDEWNVIAVRLSIAQTYYLYYPDYQKDLGTIVAAAKSLGLYLILELHGYDANNLSSAQPDPNGTPMFWAQLAARFGQESHVLFDIWNEPHSVPWSTWKANAEKIITAIRQAGANDTLILVGGLDWAYDLSPLLDPANRITGLGPIIYATHPYPWKTPQPSMAAEWELRFGSVSDQVPVIVTEYGTDDTNTSGFGLGSRENARAWLSALHAFVDQRSLSALAWSVGDMPHLTLGANGGGVVLPSNPPDPGRPTDPFGVDVQAWMRKPLM